MTKSNRLYCWNEPEVYNIWLVKVSGFQTGTNKNYSCPFGGIDNIIAEIFKSIPCSSLPAICAALVFCLEPSEQSPAHWALVSYCHSWLSGLYFILKCMWKRRQCELTYTSQGWQSKRKFCWKRTWKFSMQMTGRRYIKFPGLCGQWCLSFSDRSPFLILLDALLMTICFFILVILRPPDDRHMRRGVQNIFVSLSGLLGTFQGGKSNDNSAILFHFFFSLLKVLLEHCEEEKQAPCFNFTHSHVCTQTHTPTLPEAGELCLQGSGWAEEQTVLMNILINLAKLI